ncbi:hypothetical protein AHF37_09832 [Paragonimus kellicotti]|nr:hypothetical protein AHF37_09832 [Paragonimus kellicotti]
MLGYSSASLQVPTLFCVYVCVYEVIHQIDSDSLSHIEACGNLPLNSDLFWLVSRASTTRLFNTFYYRALTRRDSFIFYVVRLLQVIPEFSTKLLLALNKRYFSSLVQVKKYFHS